MSEIVATQQSKLFRLWSVPLFVVGPHRLVAGLSDDTSHHLLFGAGALLMAVFAFRHNLMDLSPKTLDPKNLGILDVTLLVISVLLVLTAVVVKSIWQGGS